MSYIGAHTELPPALATHAFTVRGLFAGYEVGSMDFDDLRIDCAPHKAAAQRLIELGMQNVDPSELTILSELVVGMGHDPTRPSIDIIRVAKNITAQGISIVNVVVANFGLHTEALAAYGGLWLESSPTPIAQTSDPQPQNIMGSYYFPIPGSRFPLLEEAIAQLQDAA
jgi:hypothetical protein